LALEAGSREMPDVARLREGVYRILSQSLLYPEEERLRLLALALADLEEEASDFWLAFTRNSEWARYVDYFEGAPDSPELRDEYVTLFMANRASAPCLLYESAYALDNPGSAGWLLAELEEEYAASGLATNPNTQEAPDHVAVQLEFMACLCQQEEAAWSQQAVEEALRLIEQERRFLRHHPLRWFPELADRVAALNGRSSWSVVTEAVHVFLLHDLELLAAFHERFDAVGGGVP
jgi:TorA maturation chaperone TorD